MDIQIIIRVPELFAAGTYSANVTAKVTEANGIDVTAITSTEEDSVSFEVMKYGSCEVMVGQGGGAIEAGDPVVFAASFICEANAEFSIGYSLVMIDEVAMSSIWPSGFEDQSAPCQFQVQATGGGGTVSSRLPRPPTLRTLGVDASYSSMMMGMGMVLARAPLRRVTPITHLWE